MDRSDLVDSAELWQYDIDVSEGSKTVMVNDGSSLWVAWLPEFKAAEHAVLADTMRRIQTGEFDKLKRCDKAEFANRIYREIYARLNVVALQGVVKTTIQNGDEIIRLLTEVIDDCTADAPDVIRAAFTEGQKLGRG